MECLLKGKEKPLTEVKSRQTLGGELFNRIFSSLETKVSGIALQPEESTTQPDFPTNVELHFNIDRTTLSTVYIKWEYQKED